MAARHAAWRGLNLQPLFSFYLLGNCVIRKDYKKQLKERAMSVIIQSGGNAGTKKNGNIRE